MFKIEFKAMGNVTLETETRKKLKPIAEALNKAGLDFRVTLIKTIEQKSLV